MQQKSKYSSIPSSCKLHYTNATASLLDHARQSWNDLMVHTKAESEAPLRLVTASLFGEAAPNPLFSLNHW